MQEITGMYDSIFGILTRCFGLIIGNYFLSITFILALVGLIITTITNNTQK